jgi:hypothetical protein
MNKKISVLLSSTAIVAAAIYLVCTSIAIMSYPLAYNPMTNWLSDLGNPTLNPSGAIYYDAGGVVTSIVLLVFFVGMYTWRSEDKRMNAFLLVAVFSGLALACAFLLTAAFPLGVNDSLHSTFSIMLFVFVGCFEIFSASAIRKSPAYPKALSVFGLIVAIINFILAVSFNFGNLYVGEWVMIGLFIVYALGLSAVQLRIKTRKI